MRGESYELFAKKAKDEILQAIVSELKNRKESPFWQEKVAPFVSAVLSVLIPLREQGLLFNPEGKAESELTPALFFRWCDFVSLKMLFFTIEASNDEGRLLRTKIESEKCAQYEPIDLIELAEYLAKYSVNLKNQDLDFPIANYNLHLGVANVIKSLL